MPKEASLKDLLLELKQQTKNSKSMRKSLREQTQDVGATSISGILLQDAVTKLKSVQIPLFSKVMDARSRAKNNKELYKSKIQGMLASSNPSSEVSKIAEAAGDEGNENSATAVNTARTATSVEKIAAALTSYISTFGSPTTSGESFGFAAGSSSMGRSEEEGDTAQAKKQSKLSRFAKVTSQTFGNIINHGRRRDRQSAKMRFSALGERITGAARFMMAGIFAGIGTVLGAIASAALPIIAGLASVVAAIATIWTIMDINKTFEDIEASEAESEKKGKKAISDFRSQDKIKDMSIANILNAQLGKINQAREEGKTKVDLYLPGYGNLKALGLDEAERFVGQVRSTNEKLGTLNMTGRDLENQGALTEFNQNKFNPKGNRPVDWHKAEGFTDTQYMEHEVQRLRDLKASGATTAKTIKDPILLSNPYALSRDNLFEEMSIERAIQVAQANMAQTQGIHIGMMRKELRRQGMIEGHGPIHDLLDKSAEQMAAERPGRLEIYANAIGKQLKFASPQMYMMNKAGLFDQRGIGTRRVNTVENINALRGRVGSINTPSAAPVIVGPTTTHNTASTVTNVQTPNMTGPPHSVNETQLAN